MKTYIIHGYGATPKDHWFTWTKNELEKLGVSTEILSLPTPNDPKPQEWEKVLEENIKDIDKDTYFVTHSLGSITFLKYLQKKGIKKLGGYILVSPFNESLSILRELDSFLEPKLDYSFLSTITKNKTVISAKDDSIVPYDLSQSVALALGAKFIALEKGGHFLDSDGFTSFPFLFEEFKSFIL